MAQTWRDTQRHPQQAFDNATYVKSVHQLAEQDSCYYNPLFEQSQGFGLVGSFDGRNPPLPYYNNDADLYAMRAAWLAAQRGIPVSGEGIWPAVPRQIQAPLPQPGHQTPAVPDSAGTSSARADSCTNRTDASTSSATSSRGGSASSNRTSTNRGDAFSTTGGDGSDCDRHESHTHGDSRDLQSPSAKRQERQLSWGTCAPVIMMALLMAFLVLVSLATMARSNRMMAAISGVGHPNFNNQKPQMVMSSATIRTVHAPALPVSASEAPKSTGSLTVSRNGTSLRVTRREAVTPTFAAEATARKGSAGNKYARHGKPTKRATVPSVLASDNFEAAEDSEDLMAFPFQRPTRPMCGDVFYTVCHTDSDQHEFHYRRSVNACVETATDTVHSCNRGVNRFASIALCRRSCVRTRQRPAEECFAKPLFTSCARQDVLSSWWFFEGRKCVPWNFPSGGCPADDSAVFRTAHECRTQCLGGLRRSPCGPPQAVACDQRHLKYPFFADLSTSDGRIRCLRSSPGVLRDLRCLTGANRFRTREACMVTCENRPTS